MKNITKFLVAFSIIFCFAACNNQPSNQADTPQPENDESIAKQCTYEYSGASTKINWTAFKTTARVGVGGAFDKFEIMPGSSAAISAVELLTGATFKIETGSTNTKNPGRDKKIVDHFFGTLLQGNIIQGKITTLNGDNQSGMAVINMAINGVEREITGVYQVNDVSVTLKASVDMANWSALASIDSLNLVCYDLHKGKDGVSKLWPDVAVEITTTLEKDCK